MSKKRKQYSPNFKAKVALAAIKGDQTTSEFAARFQIHSTMISTWKRELLERAPDLFDSKSGNKSKSLRMRSITFTGRSGSFLWNEIF